MTVSGCHSISNEGKIKLILYKHYSSKNLLQIWVVRVSYISNCLLTGNGNQGNKTRHSLLKDVGLCNKNTVAGALTITRSRFGFTNIGVRLPHGCRFGGHLDSDHVGDIQLANRLQSTVPRSLGDLMLLSVISVSLHECSLCISLCQAVIYYVMTLGRVGSGKNNFW